MSLDLRCLERWNRRGISQVFLEPHFCLTIEFRDRHGKPDFVTPLKDLSRNQPFHCSQQDSFTTAFFGDDLFFWHGKYEINERSGEKWDAIFN